MPYHKLLDCLEEDRLAGKKFGSTRRGIAPVYADKYMKKTLRMGDLLDLEAQAERVADIVEWKNLTVEKGYGHAPIRADEVMDWLRQFGLPWREFICDTSLYLDQAAGQGKDILFEAQLGALRDIDFGIFPYTSSSSTISAYAPVGAGLPGRRLDSVIGIMKAYSSCVGEGPFTCEFFGEQARQLREAGTIVPNATRTLIIASALIISIMVLAIRSSPSSPTSPSNALIRITLSSSTVVT